MPISSIETVWMAISDNPACRFPRLMDTVYCPAEHQPTAVRNSDHGEQRHRCMASAAEGGKRTSSSLGNISRDRAATLLLVAAVESVRVALLNALIERRRPGVFRPSKLNLTKNSSGTNTDHRCSTPDFRVREYEAGSSRDPRPRGREPSRKSLRWSQHFDFEPKARQACGLKYHRVPYIAHCFSA